MSPNDHANFGQSTNDTYPTALHLAMYYRSEDLLKALQQLVQALLQEGGRFKNVLKMGRTHTPGRCPDDHV